MANSTAVAAVQTVARATARRTALPSLRPMTPHTTKLVPAYRPLRSTTCPYSTASPSSISIKTSSRPALADVSLARAALRPVPRSAVLASLTRAAGARRTYADLASASAAAPKSSPTSAAAAATSGPQLDWNTFFKLRKTRRRFQLVCSIVTLLGGSMVGVFTLAGDAGEVVTKWVPLDPFITLGLAATAFAAMGWLVGPSIGNGLFYMFNRRWKVQMKLKENEFFARIKKHRVDPANSSPTRNPVPDFYGEKISSVAGYRQWLKDQRAFNKKRFV